MADDQVYLWAGEHFCEPDTQRLYNAEQHRVYNPEIGFPQKVDGLPDPETFCAVCLQWFTDPAKIVGVDHHPPEGETA